jgi:hypothetical protein
MFYDSARDPIDNTIPFYHFWKSVTSTGNSTTIFNDLFIPVSPNFPPMSTGSPTRYMINLPGQPYYDGVVNGTYPLLIKNVNTSTILTRIVYNGTLTANTYKIFPASAETPSRMEVHVGTGSNQAGDKISFQGYFINQLLSPIDYGISMPINAWNMSSASYMVVNLDNNNLYPYIVGISAMIYYYSTGTSNIVSMYPLPYASPAGYEDYIEVDLVNNWIKLYANSTFWKTGTFDSTSYIRGRLKIDFLFSKIF